MRRITVLAAGLLVAGIGLPTAQARPLPPRTATPPRIVAPQSAAAETTWFGGTHWDAADQRWEANPGGLWTFDSGIGSSWTAGPVGLGKPPGYHSRMEGWVGANLYMNPGLRSLIKFQRRQRSEFAGGPASCVGSDASPLGGDASLWAGLTQPEAAPLCWPGGQGYGNNWNIGQAQTLSYAGGVVHLDFNYTLDSEPGFDYGVVIVSWSPSVDPIQVWGQSGTAAGHVSLTLNPGVDLPDPAVPVTIAFRFQSDGGYSDEDGGFDSACGGFAVDDIVLTGGISHVAHFESGNDGWSAVGALPTPNDFSDLRAVAGLPVAPGCYLGDSVLTFASLPAGGLVPYHPCWQDNVALSPWIDLDQAGISGVLGVLLDTGGYFDGSLANLIGFRFGAQIFPDTCAAWGTVMASEFHGVTSLRNYPTPVCSSVTGYLRQSLSAFVPASSRVVRVGLGVHNYGADFSCNTARVNSPGPWFDNVRVGIVHAAVSGVGPGPGGGPVAGIMAVVPNPWSSAAPLRIDYRGRPGETGAVAIDVIDVAGRFIRRVEASLDNAAWATIAWDGRDAAGRNVREGIYFLRTEGTGPVSTRKIVLVR